MSRMKQILITVSIPIFITTIAIASDWREDAKAIDISGGEAHTLVLTRNKWPWACGPNSWYQLGIGDTTTSQTRLVRVYGGAMNTPQLQDINDVDSGWKHSLALESYSPSDPNYMGYVWAWGNDEWGELGNGPAGTSGVPVRVLRGEQVPADPNDPNLARIVDISAGRSGEHSLAVDANGYAYAWGRNTHGQCGNGESDYNQRELTPVVVLAGDQNASDPNSPLQQIIAVSAGQLHSMGLEAYDPCDPNWGRVYTWGNDTFGPFGERGLLGTGGTGDSSEVRPVCVWAGEQDYNEPGQVNLKHIVAVSAGWGHSMALEKYDQPDPLEKWVDPCGTGGADPNHKGRVYTWGNNAATPYSDGGRLGNDSTTSSSTPVLVLRGEQEPEDPCDPNLTRIVAISAGEGHSMALDVGGYVYCWGDNRYGQLGDGTEEDSLVPVKVVGEDGEGYLDNIVAISAGYWHSIAVDANGTIWTWGIGTAGPLGLGNKTINCNTPHPIPVVYNITQETFAFSIQGAIDDANDAEDILGASPGTYYENVNFRDKSVTLSSTEPGDWDVAADTVIDAAYNSGDNPQCYAAVDFNDGSGSTLAGLTTANAIGSGVWCAYVDGVSIVNCLIRNNDCDGIYCVSGSDVNVLNCIIADNAGDGIYFGSNGVSSGPQIKNNWIYDNGGTGVRTNYTNYEPNPLAAIVNSTIVGNDEYGVASYYATDINIASSIIWGNGSSASDNLHGSNGTFTVKYSCIQGGYGVTEDHNIDSDPCFVEPDANDFHLAANSLCIDTGDPGFEGEPNETDIDGENRVVDGDANATAIVDMGADEFYWSEADYSGDGLVNFIDYAMLTAYWEDAGVDYNDVFLHGDVNSVGLEEFCDQWLWEAGWLTGPMPLKAGRSAEGLSLQVAPYELSAAEEKPVIAEPVDVEKLLDWLAQIWLDPEVRERIDADAWLKLYESVKAQQ